MKSIARKIARVLIGVLVIVCAGSPVRAQSRPADELDAAIREISDYLNRQLPAGTKLVILNIQSEYPALSEYIIDDLIANTVNDRIFTVVDRRQLDVIRAELGFQMSGEVDDNTAQELGRMAGAQIIVSGAVSKIGNLYRLRVRALSVQTAQIEGQFNRNIPDGPTVAALARSQATGYSGSDGRPAATPAAPVSAPAESAGEYHIGDTGPAGGIVFYVERGNSGMEVSRLLGAYTWDEAVQAAKDYDGGGMSGWYLPTASELNLIVEPSAAIRPPIEFNYSKDERREALKRYEELYVPVREFAFNNDLDAKQVSVLLEYTKTFNILVAVEMKPFYTALSPEFFVWMTKALKPN
jgi:TolB-like protein